jgi:hypothetical protein
MNNDNRLLPLTDEEKSFIGILDIDLNTRECISFLEAFISPEIQPTTVPENAFPMLAQLGHMFKNKKWINNLPKAKDQVEQKNLLQNILYKAGLEIYIGKGIDHSQLELQKIIEKFSVDPAYQLELLSEDEIIGLEALGSHTAQIRSEASKVATRRKVSSIDNNYRLLPLTEEEQSFIGPLGIDLNNRECISFLEAFISSEKQPTPVPENDFPMLAQLGHMFKNKKWVNNLPKAKNQVEKKNLIQNILYKAGLEVYGGKGRHYSLLELQNIIDKFSVDPDYRLDPLSEDEIVWLEALGVDGNNAGCTSYIEAFLEKRKKTEQNGPEQKQRSVNEQRNEHSSDSSQNNESSLLTKLKKIFNDFKWVSNIPEPKDESEKKNLIQNIIYKAGIEDTDDGEFDSLLILPASRQIIGKFQLLHLVLGAS